MPHHATIESLPQAFRLIKEMGLEDVSSEYDYRVDGRQALKRVLEERMESRIDHYLDEVGRCQLGDRRNGSFSRHLVTELGDIELSIPRTRKTSAVGMIKRYARRGRHVDRMILLCFVLGHSTRKVAEALLPVLGEKISASTVSRVAATLDDAVKAFHRRPLTDRYRFLLLDGVVLKRRTGAGSVKRFILVALGITSDNRRELIDFHIAQGESSAAWETFLTDLYQRGLTGDSLELICTDGGTGLLSALPFVYPRVPEQRCWAHKTRNVLDRVRRRDREAVKRSLHTISHARGLRTARAALGRFVSRWQELYPAAVRCLIKDEEALLAFYGIDEPKIWTRIRTTNAIERRFVEVRRRTRPMGVFADRTSMERILYSIFIHLNRKQGRGTRDTKL